MSEKSFLEQFFESVNDHLGDPYTSTRTTKQKKLRLLRTIEQQTWERLLFGSGQESTLSRADADITLENGVSHYLLPGNFRQFLTFERYDNGDRNRVLGKMPSIAASEDGPGVEILDGQRGMIVRPTPGASDNDQVWTLAYQKGPIIHHHSIGEVGARTLTMIAPTNPDAGTMVAVDRYYDGSLVEVYDADTGAPQTREVLFSVVVKKNRVRCLLRHAWSPMPAGTVRYQTRPCIPDGYDDIYALGAAMRLCPARLQRTRMTMLLRLWREQLTNCRSLFTSNVADRAPTRTNAQKSFRQAPDPYGDE